jgi:hypothetical protein
MHTKLLTALAIAMQWCACYTLMKLKASILMAAIATVYKHKQHYH